jgi:hypothetical protein
VKSFRHWFSQTLINQNVSCIDTTQEFTDFPSIGQLTASSSSQATGSQNGIVELENNFGANIQNT